ncbi:class I SAM-dependent methyltransferase [Streptomyces sp. MUM 203J]|uniref:class I SAM-dependent DNA methyltransferase n=1 Tax=Streptomyces sp. MUM 203J TaxID=2791990 RepID=UPI001F0498B9|nr:class I SAM-dependent methyltransferase [Streptomyces sp. MUM 203J]MCH0541483.1 class I SAM-dependent methyltransferase [Streptomyces sp. MUM 203J]
MIGGLSANGSGGPHGPNGRGSGAKPSHAYAAWGDYWAGVLDDWIGGEIDADCLAVLCDLADGGDVLELGIGTGRVAIPLARSGLTVHGFELSDAMIEKLREKPYGDKITVFQDNYVDVAVEGTYRLVPWIDWGPVLLHSQEEQLTCFRNVAKRLEPGGYFVIEMPIRLPLPDGRGNGDGNEHLVVESINPSSVGLWAVDYNPVDQTMFTQQVLLEDGSVTVAPVRMRYASPSELDLMARMADLELCHRWADWRRSPITSSSQSHISVYRKSPSA